MGFELLRVWIFDIRCLSSISEITLDNATTYEYLGICKWLLSCYTNKLNGGFEQCIFANVELIHENPNNISDEKNVK